MELKQTRNNIDRLSRNPSISQEDAVNFIYDFCTEVKRETGTGLDAGASGDIEELLRHLPWLGQFVLNVVKRNEAGVVSEDRRRRLGKLSEQLAAAGQKLEEANADCERMTAQRRALEEKEAAFADKNARLLALTQEIRDLEDRICRIENVDIAQIEKQKADRREDLENLSRRVADLAGEAEALAGQIGKSEQERAAKEEALAVRQKELARQQELAQTAEAETRKLREEIAELGLRRESVLRMKDEKLREKEELNRRIDQENLDCARLREDIRLLESTLGGKDFEEQKRLLEEQKKELREESGRYEAVSREIEEAKKQTERQKADRLAKAQELTEKNNELRKAIEDTAAEMESLRQKHRELDERYAERLEALKKKRQEIEQVNADLLESLARKRKELENREAALKEKAEDEEDWLESLDGVRCRERVKILEKRLSVIAEARERLEKDLTADWVTNRYGFSSKAGLAGDRLQKRIRNLETELGSVREALDAVCECISSGQLD